MGALIRIALLIAAIYLVGRLIRRVLGGSKTQEPAVPVGDRLFELLAELDDEELAQLWTDGLCLKPEKEGFDRLSRRARMQAISKAWRAEHGNAIRNVARGPHDLPWKKMLVDVADRIHPDLLGSPFRVADTSSEADLERAVLDLYNARIGSVWDRLRPEQRENLRNGILPRDDGLIGAVATKVDQLRSDRSLATTVLLLNAHEWRRLMRAGAQPTKT